MGSRKTFKVEIHDEEIAMDLARKIAKAPELPPLIVKKIAFAVKLIAHDTVFSGNLLDFGIRTGKTREESFSVSKAHRGGKSAYRTVYSRMNNLYANFKQPYSTFLRMGHSVNAGHKQVQLLALGIGELEKSGAISRIIEHQLKLLDAE